MQVDVYIPQHQIEKMGGLEALKEKIVEWIGMQTLFLLMLFAPALVMGQNCSELLQKEGDWYIAQIEMQSPSGSDEVVISVMKKVGTDDIRLSFTDFMKMASGNEQPVAHLFFTDETLLELAHQGGKNSLTPSCNIIINQKNNNLHLLDALKSKRLAAVYVYFTPENVSSGILSDRMADIFAKTMKCIEETK